MSDKPIPPGLMIRNEFVTTHNEDMRNFNALLRQYERSWAIHLGRLYVRISWRRR